MSRESQPIPNVFQIDVSPTSSKGTGEQSGGSNEEVTQLLRALAAGQQQQNQLLEQLVQQTTAAQKQRANEFQRWRDANPQLARDCRAAAESLSRVQSSFIENLAEEAMDQEEAMLDGGFMLSEFVDRFGPRLAHLNGVLQVISQLGGNPESNT
ncbi:hypothetical protein [Lignipirellula cremea]|uniref:Uncharacterized protein n=1 Tax=Lignipirellula cremea TaxID=2528010 RepID=A0A518DPF8_9BACT|nr:hypothetical protein [Lignipirellula cremea]QDU93721.1 hypothetical protein Pla8534_15030 [Lignipirellula cremea]